jgi:hypothetical protein
MTLDHLREIALIQISQSQRNAAMTVYSPTTHISDERIAELEARGERARQECRSRSNTTFGTNIERKAFQRGWDREQAKQEN